MKADPKQIPTVNDTADIWIAWYDALQDSFGKKTANQLFVKAWKLRGSTDKSTNALRDHLKKNGIEIPTTWGQDVIDKGSDISDIFGDMFHMGKYFGIAIAVIAVGGTAMIIYNLAKNPAQSAGTIIKYAK